MTTRALSQQELNILRSSPQRSELYLAFYVPNVIYRARLASVPSSTDKVVQISYTSGSGTLSDVRVGMTLLVGTTYGGAELGMCRIRKTPTSDIFYIGETSDIAWQSDAYLTVIDDYMVWPRHPRISGTTVYMDYDVAYSGQHDSPAAVPVMGPHAVVWLRGTSVSVSFDASRSWKIGGSITSYSWSAPGSVSISGASTATPTITYNAPGYYSVYCTVNSQTTGVRHVFVFSDSAMPVSKFTLNSCGGSFDNGGWDFSVDLYDEAAFPYVRDRALAVLFARDFYGSNETSIGPYTGRGNIIAIGRITGETIAWNRDHSVVSFVVSGSHEELRKMATPFPFGLEWVAGSSSWTNMPSLTVDKALWHLLYWRTTACTVMDVVLTGDTRYAIELSSTATTLWGQMEDVARSILAAIGVDQYDGLYVFQEPQLLTTTQRSSIPVIQTISKDDWEHIEFSRETWGTLAAVDLSGVSVGSNREVKPIFSLSPGHVSKVSGAVQTVDGLLLSEQSSANELAGLYSGWKNNRVPGLSVTMPNHRMCTLFPAQYYSITINAGDTERNIEYSGKIIPRGVEYQFENGMIRAVINAEAETFADVAVNGDIPQDAPLQPIPPLPPIGIPSNKIGPKRVMVLLATGGLWYTTNFDEEYPAWFSANGGIPPGEVPDICSYTIVGNALWFATRRAKLYRAKSIGGYATAVIDETWMTGQGYNPSGGDAVYVVGSWPDGTIAFVIGNGFVNRGDVWVGTEGSFSLVGSIGSVALGGACSYCGGKLVAVCHARFSSSKHARFSKTAIDWHVYLPYYNASHRRSGNAPLYSLAMAAAGGHFYLVPDNGGSSGDPDDFVEITCPASTVPDSFSCNGTGLLMFASTAETPYRSSDGGSTWVPITGGNPFLYSLHIGGLQWIVGGTKVGYTPDFGNTWYDKTGDLSSAISRYGAIHGIRIW